MPGLVPGSKGAAAAIRLRHNSGMSDSLSGPLRVQRCFEKPAVALAVAVEQSEVIPVLATQIGVRGLYLRPSPAMPRELSGNMLQSVTCMHLGRDGWEGDLRCEAGTLPFAGESFSLIYLLHVLEAVPDPAALVRECARCLQPEGLLVLLGFNRWSPFRLRLPRGAGRLLDAASLERLAVDAGLVIEECEGVGCLWRGRPPVPSEARPQGPVLRSLTGRWRSSCACIARKREAAPTLVGPARTPLRVRASPS